MKIVLAPDSFKGSLSAARVSAALAEGIRRSDAGIEILEHPLADGGEGTLDACVRRGFSLQTAVVRDSWGAPITALWALRGNTAVIESAQAFGFRPGATAADALSSSSAGVGELILEALDHGCTRIILFVGGTSGTDAGVGMLQALGARALDASGGDCAPGGAGLVDLDTVDTTHRDPRLAGVEFIVASDVTNPLLGAKGAAHIFAPQKGADRAAVEILEAGLTRAAEVISPAHATRPGSGAGGGLAYGALAVLGAHVESGAEAVMAMTGFEESLEGADCVVTGEGSFDDQSLEGKITGTVIARCRERGIPVVVVCGISRITQPVLGLRIVEISAGAASLEDSITRAEGLLRDAGVRILELIT